MLIIRRGPVITAEPAHAGLTRLTVDLDGEPSPAIAYDALVGPLAVGDVVLINTTAMTLGLGTGGVHLVIAVEGREDRPDMLAGHAMKLRYAPSQVAVDAVEERFPERFDAVRDLGEMPVVVAGLHSALAPAAIGARAVAPEARIVYVMTDAAALAMPFSATVPALRGAGLLDATITAGQAFGGDHEAVTIFSALLAARAVEDADVIIVAMGPGNLGTGSPFGFALMETAVVVNAVAALGGRPIVVPRMSLADARDRHRGISHHTMTALSVGALARATIVFPPLPPERAALIEPDRARLAERHEVVVVDVEEAEAALAASPLLSTMGRGFTQEPDGFRAAAAAGIYAARMAGGNDGSRR